MTDQKIKRRIRVLVILLIVVIIISLTLGRYWVDPLSVIKIILSEKIPLTKTWTSQAETVILQVRLPRVLLGLFVGAGLSLAGATYQGIFQNPMVSPDILGASWGAAFGAALALFFSCNYFMTTFISFLFGLFSVSLVCLVGRVVKNNITLGYILAGIMIGSIFSSSISFLKLVADPLNTLPAITYWLMGSLSSSMRIDVYWCVPFMIAGMIPIILLRWKINLLTMGEEEARSMGVNVRKVQLVLIMSATLITAAAVSVSGMIGWIGLIIPHFTRMIVGNDYRRIIPVSLVLGGGYLLLVDDFARMLFTMEIPIGILTSFIGAPFFIYLMMKEGKKIL